jgi:peptidyl-tRNA hydrolase, PTH1 family
LPDDRWLVVGLGNPGDRYAGTRHNAGALTLDLMAERVGGRWKAHKSRCEVVEGRVAGVPAVLAKPTTYMNESGGPVANAAKFFSVPLDRIVVVHDELDLPFATVRVKQGGGDGGHNGLRSVTSSLHGKDYLRVRVGIGRPPGRQDPADYVLKPFSAAERKDLDWLVDHAADAAESLLTRGLLDTQNTLH